MFRYTPVDEELTDTSTRSQEWGGGIKYLHTSPNTLPSSTKSHHEDFLIFMVMMSSLTAILPSYT